MAAGNRFSLNAHCINRSQLYARFFRRPNVRVQRARQTARY